MTATKLAWAPTFRSGGDVTPLSVTVLDHTDREVLVTVWDDRFGETAVWRVAADAVIEVAA
ncbi:hypothetical protein nbrc107696_46030 [Gordonia spumicola]|uniref:Uncharacterized protein n=1 Tax=Gordonia spumicola TaxID=589161 RepID=A0A7I9V480_9ACTN|nr:hypothetical protein [Gordonia spumicola]GEE00228.1 hypothetical protein nbrc107696_06740 [Gordonia spumicola]GEE04157.1 hypothetical protein nbrc107696_46030 [Gordonia spumicola]